MTTAVRGGTVVDGTGAPPVRADVLMDGDRVRAVGPDAGVGADTVIDADRHARHARLRRPAHPLRRPAVLGPQRQPVAAPRRDHRARGQLRFLAGAHGPEHVDYMAA